jgi:hypothetical protein
MDQRHVQNVVQAHTKHLLVQQNVDFVNQVHIKISTRPRRAQCADQARTKH